MELTKKHIAIFKHYDGDGDALIRLGTEEEKSMMNYKTWMFLDELIQDIILVKKKLVAESLKARILDKLSNTFKDEETIDHLLSYIRNELLN